MEQYRFGDMLALAKFVEEHHGALTADFQREYSLNLDEEVAGGISSSRMDALISHLGPGTAIFREINPEWSWGNQEELLALIAELIDRLDRHFVMANSQNGKAWEPISIPRPFRQESQPQKGTTMEELKGLIAQHRKEVENGN